MGGAAGRTTGGPGRIIGVPLRGAADDGRIIGVLVLRPGSGGGAGRRPSRRGLRVRLRGGRELDLREPDLRGAGLRSRLEVRPRERLLERLPLGLRGLFLRGGLFGIFFALQLLGL